MDAKISQRWLERKVNGTPRLRMFCLPYAGGGARYFREWASRLDANVEVCAIRLPGRERRWSEPPLRRVDQATEILIEVLRPYLDLSFVVFGHSMGAILAYEVARGILAATGAEPLGLFVSGHRAPHLPLRRRMLHQLPRDELIAEIRALKGTPDEVFQNADLVDFVLPTLRSDLELVETYTKQGDSVLSCTVIAMGGTADHDVSSDDLAGWRSVTTGPFKTILFEGDHFYLNDARTSFLLRLRLELAALDPQ